MAIPTDDAATRHTVEDDHSHAPPPKIAAETLSIEVGPPLFRDRSFWGLTATQFFGAFNDNLYKQMLLLLFVAVPGADEKFRDIQGLALLSFSLPFILFSGYAGYLSDKYSKRRMIVVCKFAEIAIMSLAVIAFYVKGQVGLSPGMIAGLSGLLFCMGTHSAFFGPGKYGILPQILRERDLPAANGLVLMTTFLGIIFGMALGGVFVKYLGEQLWIGGCFCVVIAVVGTVTSLLIRPVTASSPGLRFEWEMVGIPRSVRAAFRADRALLLAVIVSTVFWLSAAIVQPAVNALGTQLLGKNHEFETSLLVMGISLGIAIGSVLAGWLSGGRVNAKVQTVGSCGMIAMLLLLAIPGGSRGQLLDYWGSAAGLILLGVFTGMFAVPLQVFVQARSPEGEKGRMIATQNLLQWVGIGLSSAIYQGSVALSTTFGWPGCIVFALTALFMLPLAVFYRAPSGDLANERPHG